MAESWTSRGPKRTPTLSLLALHDNSAFSDWAPYIPYRLYTAKRSTDRDEAERTPLMRGTPETIRAAPDLSKDVLEFVSKALG